jgi:hypothetical protein
MEAILVAYNGAVKWERIGKMDKNGVAADSKAEGESHLG